MKKDILKRARSEHRDFRNFSYAKNNVNLAFTLRLDTDQELKDFLELLGMATEDIKRELEGK